MRLLVALALLLLAVGVFAQSKLPGDVSAFVDRREFIFRQVKTLCRGTDKQLAGLRKKYAKNKEVVQKLAGYEDASERK